MERRQKHAATQAHTHTAKYKCWVYKFQLPTFCIINYIGQKKKVNKYTKYNYFINYQQLLSLMLLKVKLPTYLSKLISPLNKEWNIAFATSFWVSLTPSESFKVSIPSFHPLPISALSLFLFIFYFLIGNKKEYIYRIHFLWFVSSILSVFTHFKSQNKYQPGKLIFTGPYITE